MPTVFEMPTEEYLAQLADMAGFLLARIYEPDDADFTGPIAEELSAHLYAVEEIALRAQNRAKNAKSTLGVGEARGLAYALAAHAGAYDSHPDFRDNWRIGRM